MKNLFVICLVPALLFSCQSNHKVVDEQEVKAEAFMSKTKGAPNTTYSAAEADHPDYRPQYIRQNLSILFEYRDQEWSAGAKAMDDLMDQIVEEQPEGLDLSSRVDLQLLTYTNLDRFIFKGPHGSQQQEFAARNLRRLMQHTEPIEWGVLAKAALLARPVLEKAEYKRFKSYIEDGANQTMEDPYQVADDVRSHDNLLAEAELALGLLGNKE